MTTCSATDGGGQVSGWIDWVFWVEPAVLVEREQAWINGCMEGHAEPMEPGPDDVVVVEVGVLPIVFGWSRMTG